MNKAWLYIRSSSKEEISNQRKALTIFFDQNNVAVAGETVEITDDPSALACVMAAIKSAIDNECDCVAIKERTLVNFSEQDVFEMHQAYVENNVTFYSLDQGDLCKPMFEVIPLIRLYFAPNMISLDEALDDGEVLDYPEPRDLDSIKVRVNRQGETKTVSYTDLLRDEQIQAIDLLPAVAVKELCHDLANTLRFIGDIFGLKRDERGQLFATSVRTVEVEENT